jgi:hypothetical protein
MDSIRTNMHSTEVARLGPPKVKLSDGRIIEGSFEVVSEDDGGQAIVIQYATPGQILIPQLRRSVSRDEWEQWQKDRGFIFAL